jgi:hypothetical protein
LLEINPKGLNLPAFDAVFCTANEGELLPQKQQRYPFCESQVQDSIAALVAALDEYAREFLNP